MSDPRRLLFDDDASDFAKSLVRSWEDERPAAGLRTKTLVALGVASVVSTAASAASAAAAPSTAPAGAAAGGSVAPKAIAAGIGWMKWTAVGALGIGAVAGGTLAWPRHETAASGGPPVATSESKSPLPVVASPLPVAPSTPPITPVVAPSPTVFSIASARSPAAPAPSPRVAPSATLNEQLAALDHARATLDEGDAIRAVALVSDYEARYRDGAFLQEADVLRIEALVKRGDHAGAQRAGARFLAAYPRSPHAVRVRSLLDANR